MQELDWRLLTLELYKEFEDICFQHRVRLTKPLIQIVPSKSFWGRWSPLERKIEISEELLLQKSWETVRSVLKHEMAHQVVTEIHQGTSDHGPDFLKACKSLDVPKAFQGASGNLPKKVPHWKEQLSVKDKDQHRRIQKLFSLASSDNENEAQAALKKAHQLLQQNNLSEADLSQSSHYVWIGISTQKQRIAPATHALCALLTEHYDVDVVISNFFDVRKKKRLKTLEIFGSPQAVLVAEYVYHYVHRSTEELWDQFKKQYPKKNRQRRSYTLGLIQGFREKLQEQPTVAKTTSSKALIALQKKALTEFIHQRHPRIHKGGSLSGNLDRDSFAGGQQSGRRLNLKNALHGENRIKLLTGR